MIHTVSIIHGFVHDSEHLTKLNHKKLYAVAYKLQDKSEVRIMVITAIKPKLWTDQGLIALGRIIRDARESRGMSLRQMAEFIKTTLKIDISYRTIDKAERAEGIPQYNTLAIIAASGIARHPVTNQMLTIDDFLNIASETHIDKIPASVDTGINMHLSEMIILAMQFYGISQEELETRLLERRSPSTFTIERLRAIQSGAEATEGERKIIYILLDKRGDVFTRKQWMGLEPVHIHESSEERNGDPCNGRF